MQLRRTLSLVAVLVVAAARPVAASPADPGGDEALLASRTNAERAASGLGSLATAGDLVAVARRHSRDMAAQGRLYHDANLANDVGGWSEVAENVGTGPSADDVHRAFMASSTHRSNILHPTFTDIGVGVAWANGRIWVTEVFRRPSAAAPPPAPPPALADRSTFPPRASRSRRAPTPSAPPPTPAPPPPPSTLAPAPVAAPTTTGAPRPRPVPDSPDGTAITAALPPRSRARRTRVGLLPAAAALMGATTGLATARRRRRRRRGPGGTTGRSP